MKSHRRIIPKIALSLLSMSAACSESADHYAGHVPGRLDGALASAIPLAPQVLVDQFGYLPADVKIAVIRNPRAGFDRRQHFIPGAQYQLRSAEDGTVILTGEPVPWDHGSVQASSGDQGWWFDFSSVQRAGRYFVYDSQKNVRSPTFSIDPNVYRPVLVAAMRMYYYQRSGMAKQPPFAQECWSDAAAYVGTGQDAEAHDVTDRANASKVRDLAGGWFDAGDTNKYVTFATQPVHQLLAAYAQHPAAFTDDFNIPESGNGIPDVIDEVKWEVDWLKRMQFDDGSVALKVGDIKVVDSSPPSSDRSARFYVPACTSSTIAAAGMFAHAALVFGAFPTLQDYATDLKARALRAWANYRAAPTLQTHCDQGIVLSGNADWSAADQAGYAVEAAVYLFAATGDTEFRDYVAAHYREARPYRDIGWSRYQPDQGESLLYFTRLPNANPLLRATILGDKLRDVRSGNGVYGFDPDDDLYRAYMPDAQYHWGSNNPRASYGNSNLDVIQYDLEGNQAPRYRQRALEILHYFHGVNPLAMTYLTNMYGLGATRSANEVFHSWYKTGTKWSDALTSECGPAPGYVPGGPNANAVKDGVPAALSPPAGQPPQKSYRDWNGIWPDASWTITEPGIYHQGAYVKLLAAFVR